MVVLLDFDGNDEAVQHLHGKENRRDAVAFPKPHTIKKPLRSPQGQYRTTKEEGSSRLNPNISNFSAALGCYPYAFLTSIDSLSLTYIHHLLRYDYAVV